MERGVIDDMKQELPAGDGPVDRMEFQRKFGFPEGFNIAMQAIPHLAPALLQIVQVRLGGAGGKRLGLMNSVSGTSSPLRNWLSQKRSES